MSQLYLYLAIPASAFAICGGLWRVLRELVKVGIEIHHNTEAVVLLAEGFADHEDRIQHLEAAA